MKPSAKALYVLLLAALLAALWALALPARGADAVVEFYRTQPDAGQYVLHETSLYELRRSFGDGFGRDRDFWRRAAEKFAENPEAARLCGERERHVEMWQGWDKKRLEEDVGCRLRRDGTLKQEWPDFGRAGSCLAKTLSSDGASVGPDLRAGRSFEGPATGRPEVGPYHADEQETAPCPPGDSQEKGALP